jgi:lysophospholipase L1-like esterase
VTPAARHHWRAVRVRSLLTLAVATALAVPVLCADGARASVLVIGDSLSIGTGPYLARDLGGAQVEMDAEVGRPSSAGVPVLAERLRPDHEVVVFDLGTNDGTRNPDVLAANLARASELAGGRCLVVATIWRPALGGASVEGQNRVVRDFAAQTGAVVVDWRAAAGSGPGLLQRDGVHATPAGYALRGTLFAEAVGNCLAGVAGIPAPQGDGRPPERPEPPPKPKQPKRRAAKIDWSRVAAWAPARLTIASFTDALAGVQEAAAQLRTGFAGAPPEAVLGAPER